MTTGVRERRRRGIRLPGILAATLLVAGLLPWLTWGPVEVRLLAVPMLLAGLLVTGVALRVHAADRPAAPAAPAPPVERGCGGCACGAGGCASGSGELPPTGRSATSG